MRLLLLTQYLTLSQNFGTPKSWTCDHGPEFKSQLMIDFCKLLGIQLHYIIPRNFNSNSPVQRFRSSLLENIRESLNFRMQMFRKKQLIEVASLERNSSIA